MGMQVVPAGGMVTFDRMRSESFSEEIAIDFDGDDVMELSQDFIYHQDGRIDILRSGCYNVFWYMAVMSGLSSVGQRFVLKQFDEETSEWAVLSSASAHGVISNSSGFAYVMVSPKEIEEDQKVTIALFNDSDAPAVLTDYGAPKASLMIRGLDLLGFDKRLGKSEDYLMTPKYSEYWSETFTGLGIGVLQLGDTFNVWGIGEKTLPARVQTPGQSYLFISSDQFQELKWYRGDPTYSVRFIVAPDLEFGDPEALYIMFDETGIHWKGSGTPIWAETQIKFTQALVLKP